MRQTRIPLSIPRMRRGWLITLMLLLLPWPVGAADETAEPRLDLSGLIREFEAANPEIKAARQRWESAKAVVPQVQTLPDPRLQIGYQRMPMVPPVVEGVMYGVGQDIPFPGKLKLKGEVAQRDAERLEQEYNTTLLRRLTERGLLQPALRPQSIDIVERNKALLTQFEKTAQARDSVGQAAQQDVFRAQVEISRILDRLAVLDQQKESLHAVERIRPMAMIGVIDVIGLIPAMWATGTGADVMKRIAAPQVGGVFSAMILTLFVIPPVYVMWRWWIENKQEQ